MFVRRQKLRYEMTDSKKKRMSLFRNTLTALSNFNFRNWRTGRESMVRRKLGENMPRVTS